MMKLFKPPESNLKGNQLKDFVQLDVRNHLIREKHVFLKASTGFGKTIAAVRCIEWYNQIVGYEWILPNKPILVIVPTVDLKQQWEGLNLKNVSIKVINTFVSRDFDIDWGFVIVDEGHRVLGEHAVLFNTVLDRIDSMYLLVLSATTKRDHELLLEKKRPNIVKYDIPLIWCYKKKLIPEHKIVCIPVSLTVEEKGKIMVAQKEFDKYAKYFNQHDIKNPFCDENELYDVVEIQKISIDDVEATEYEKVLKSFIIDGKELNEGQVRGMLKKWRNATTTRKNLLQSAKKKIESAKILLSYIQDKKCLIFGKSIDQIEQLIDDNTNAYHSKVSEKDKLRIFTEFFNGDKSHLASINTIIEGWDMTNYAKTLGFDEGNVYCSTAMLLAFGADAGKLTQLFGRILRYNELYPDLESTLYIFYIDDFTVRTIKYRSQEKKWLIESLKDQVNIYWYTLDEVLDGLEQ